MPKMNPIRARVYALDELDDGGPHVWICEVRDNSRPEDHQILSVNMCAYWRTAIDNALELVPRARQRDAEAKAGAGNG